MSDPRRCLCGCGQALPAGSNRGEARKYLNREHKQTFERQDLRVGTEVLVGAARRLELTGEGKTLTAARAASPITRHASRGVA